MTATPGESSVQQPPAFEAFAHGEIPTQEQAVELLSYADVLVGQEREYAIAHTTSSRHGLEYADTLIELVKQHGLGVQDVVEQVRQSFDGVDDSRYRFEYSKFAKSKSWILWDLAKQKYLADHPQFSSALYELADPFTEEGKFKVEEIADRHLGWELNLADMEGRISLNDLSATFRSPDLYVEPGTRKPDGQLRSNVLGLMGRAFRKGSTDKRYV